MVTAYSPSHYKRRPRGGRILRGLFLGLAVLLLLVSLVPALSAARVAGRRGDDTEELLALWNDAAYEEVFARSGELLDEKPLDFFLLTIHGFAAYQLSTARITRADTLACLDACVWSLRKAQLARDAVPDGRIYYVLGKAYYDRGQGYADLAVTYLEKARDAGCDARDIPQYLGLAYAALGDYRGSVAAFSLALAGQPSDLFLLAIARSYLALGEGDSARAYLTRCVDTSRDARIVAEARLLLGGLMAESGDAAGAETQYLTALEEGGESAEAHYRLGELYDAGGDPVRARAEWRKAYKIDPAHGPTRARLNL